MVLPKADKVSIEFVSFGDQTFEAIEKGRLDLMLNADDGYLPPRFASEMIFDDSYSCVAAKESKYPRAFTLKQDLAAEHVGVGIWDELQTLPDKRLAGIGAKRRCPIWVPYFTAAVRCVPGTRLLATVPTRIARFESNNLSLRVLKPPEALGRFNYLMAWHPRMNTDAAHIWLRMRSAKWGLRSRLVEMGVLQPSRYRGTVRSEGCLTFQSPYGGRKYFLAAYKIDDPTER
jgi:DNA-binding transcriptional LysR family regulator